jgi:hypothetical protein
MRLLLFVGVSLLSSQLWSQEPASLGKPLWRTLATRLGAPDGIEAATGNAFYVSDNVGGDLFWAPRGGGNPVKLASGLQAPADLVVDRGRGLLIVPENSANRLSVYRLPSGR